MGVDIRAVVMIGHMFENGEEFDYESFEEEELDFAGDQYLHRDSHRRRYGGFHSHWQHGGGPLSPQGNTAPKWQGAGHRRHRRCR